MLNASLFIDVFTSQTTDAMTAPNALEVSSFSAQMFSLPVGKANIISVTALLILLRSV